MKSILTNAFATLTGAAVAIGAVTLVEYVGHQIYPPPTDLSLDGLKAYVAAAPWQALAIVVAGWVSGAFLGAIVATAIARTTLWPGLLVGALITAGAAMNLTLIPHPLWMAALGLLLPLPSAWLGARLTRTKAQS